MHFAIIVLYSAIAALFLFCVNFKLKRWKLESLGSKIPGPRPYPLLGNTLTFASLRSAKDLWEVGIPYIKKCKEEFGPMFRVWMGPMLVVCVADLDHIHSLMSTPAAATKHWWYMRLFNFMSRGVFGTNGKEWQDLRKSLMRYFPIKEIESYMEIFVAKSIQLVSKAEKKIGAGVFNVHDLVKFYPLDIVAVTHLGADDFNEMDENKHNFHHHLERTLELSFTRALKPQYLVDSLYHLTAMGKENIKVNYDVTAVSRRIVQQRLNVLQSRGIDLTSDFEEEYYTDAVIKRGAREKHTLQEMALTITDVVVGGSDTTALGFAYTLLCLAMHPEYQERAYREQIEIFGDSDRPPTFKEAQGMPYLTMCFREALRLHGPVGIAREMTEDFDVGGYTLPKGAAAFLLFYLVHRDPNLYCRPDEYYPDHFLPEACSKRPKVSFYPFSHGTRGCPGSLYSHVSTKMALSLLIRKFRFSSPLKYADLKFRYCLMVENLDGYPVEIHKRTQRESA